MNLICFRVAHLYGQIQAEVGDVREGVGGVEYQRRQHRENFLLKVGGQLFLLPRFELVVVEGVDTHLGQSGLQIFEPAVCGLGKELGTGAVNSHQLFARA